MRPSTCVVVRFRPIKRLSSSEDLNLRAGLCDGGADLIVVLPQQELIGHAGNVIANHAMKRLSFGLFLVEIGHGIGMIRIELEKLVERRHGSFSILDNRRKRIQIGEKKLLHLSRVTRTFL